MPSAASKPTQFDIFGNEVPYQNLVQVPVPPKTKAWYVYFVRSVRDWRSLVNPDTGTVYRYVTEVPEDKLKSLVGWGRLDGSFDSLEAAKAAAQKLVNDYVTFSASVWDTYYRKNADPVYTFTHTTREQVYAEYAKSVETAEPNIKVDKRGQKKMREQS